MLVLVYRCRLLRDFRKYCHKATGVDGLESTVFDKKTFLSVHPSLKDFGSHLFQTQLFQKFIENSSTIR